MAADAVVLMGFAAGALSTAAAARASTWWLSWLSFSPAAAAEGSAAGSTLLLLLLGPAAFAADLGCFWERCGAAGVSAVVLHADACCLVLQEATKAVTAHEVE
jgi:hypothetical protein